ncbi:MAG: hypothetical protein LBC41_08145 [Clostridiales bacterium]|jgi:hypothetical protein|nr:hypothetical protein [Clostridiales bacterium]
MKSKQGLAIAIIFFFAIGASGAWALAAPKPTFSDWENRELAPLPSLIVNGSLNQNFYQEFERYYTDAFPFRETLVKANQFLSTAYKIDLFSPEDEIKIVAVDRSHEVVDLENKAVLDDDGNDNNENENESVPAFKPVTKKATPTPTPTPAASLTSFTAILNNMIFEIYRIDQKRMEKATGQIDALALECGIPTYALFPPAASELYLPSKYRSPENEQAPMFDYLGKSLENVAFVNTFQSFLRSKSGYLFFRTDHHWTADGAYIAFIAYCNQTGWVPLPRSDYKSGERSGFLGSLSKQLAASPEGKGVTLDTVKYYMPQGPITAMNYSSADMSSGDPRSVVIPDYSRNTNLYSIFFGGDTALLHMKNESERVAGRSVMVVRDSYGHAFLPFMASEYEDVYAVEPRYFSNFQLADFIKEHEIDELLFLNNPFSVSAEYWLDWTVELDKLKDKPEDEPKDAAEDAGIPEEPSEAVAEEVVSEEAVSQEAPIE